MDFTTLEEATPGAPNIGPVPFIRGDIDEDGEVNDTDLDLFFDYLAGDVETICPDRLDINDDERIDVSDGTFLAQALAGERQIPLPFPDPGPDPSNSPTGDDLPECMEEGDDMPEPPDDGDGGEG